MEAVASVRAQRCATCGKRVGASVIDIHEELTAAAAPASVFGANYKKRHQSSNTLGAARRRVLPAHLQNFVLLSPLF